MTAKFDWVKAVIDAPSLAIAAKLITDYSLSADKDPDVFIQLTTAFAWRRLQAKNATDGVLPLSRDQLGSMPAEPLLSQGSKHRSPLPDGGREIEGASHFPSSVPPEP